MFLLFFGVACVFGGIVYYVLLQNGAGYTLAMGVGVCSILLTRLLAAWLRWDLPRIP